MKPIPRWLELAIMSAFVMIMIYDYTRHHRFTLLMLSFLLVIVFYVWSWIAGKRFTVKKSYPRLRFLLLTVGLILGFLAVFGYLLLVTEGQVMMPLLFVLGLLGAIGLVIAGFFAGQAS